MKSVQALCTYWKFSCLAYQLMAEITPPDCNECSQVESIVISGSDAEGNKVSLTYHVPSMTVTIRGINQKHQSIIEAILNCRGCRHE